MQQTIIQVMSNITVSQTIVWSVVIMFVTFEISIGLNTGIKLLWNVFADKYRPLPSDKIIFEEIEKALCVGNTSAADYFKMYVETNSIAGDMSMKIYEFADFLRDVHQTFNNKKLQHLKTVLSEKTDIFANIMSKNTTSGQFWKPWNEGDGDFRNHENAKQKIQEFTEARKGFLKAYQEFVLGCKKKFKTLP